METKIKYGDEEVSEKVVEKIRQEAERDLKKELFRQVVRKDYKCANPACQGMDFFTYGWNCCQFF